MSYILDALKKVEREKARKDKHSGMANISGELFNEDLSSRRSGNNLAKIAIVVVLVALVTSGLTWYLLKGKNQPSELSQRPAVQTAPPVVAPSPVPVVPPSVQPPVPPVTSPVPVPSTVLPVASQPAPNPTPLSEANTGNSDEGEVSQRRRSRAARLPVPAPVTSQPHQPASDNQSMQAPVDIKVSGIAWQDERRARRAVINGFLLHEGSIISGAKVTEILQDRVRFSQLGKTFEISLVSAGIPLNK